MLAPAIAVCASLTSLDLSSNISWERRSDGPAFAKALAPGIASSGSLTLCDLRENNLGVEGWTIIFNALRDSPTSKITKWDLFNEKVGPEIAKPLAEYISVTASMTWLDVKYNSLGKEGEAALRKAIEGRSGFELLL